MPLPGGTVTACTTPTDRTGRSMAWPPDEGCQVAVHPGMLATDRTTTAPVVLVTLADVGSRSAPAFR